MEEKSGNRLSAKIFGMIINVLSATVAPEGLHKNLLALKFSACEECRGNCKEVGDFYGHGTKTLKSREQIAIV